MMNKSLECVMGVSSSNTSELKGKELLCSSNEVKSEIDNENSDDDDDDNDDVDSDDNDDAAVMLRMLRCKNIDLAKLSALLKSAEEQRKLKEDIGRVESSHDSSSSSLDEVSESRVVGEAGSEDGKEVMVGKESTPKQDHQQLTVQNCEQLLDEEQKEQEKKPVVTQSLFGKGMVQQQLNENSQSNQPDGLIMSCGSPQQHCVSPSDAKQEEPCYTAYVSGTDTAMTAMNEADALIVSKECANVSKDRTAQKETDKFMQGDYWENFTEINRKKSTKRARNDDSPTLVIGKTCSRTAGGSERNIISAPLSDEPCAKLKKLSRTHTKEIRKVSKSSDLHGYQQLMKKAIDEMLRDKNYEIAVNEMKTWGSDFVEEGTRLAYEGLTANGIDESEECFSSLLKATSRTSFMKHELATEILSTIGLNIFLHLANAEHWNGAHKVYSLMLHRNLDPMLGKILSSSNQASPSKKLLLWVLSQISVGNISRAADIIMSKSLSNGILLKALAKKCDVVPTCKHFAAGHNMASAKQHSWGLPSDACDLELRDKACMEIMKRFNYYSSKDAVMLFQHMVQHQVILNTSGFPLLLDQVLQRLIYHNSLKSACELVQWAHDIKQWKLSNEITVRVMLIKLLTLVDSDTAPYSHCIQTLIFCPPYYHNLPTKITGLEDRVQLLVNSNWFQLEVNAVIKFFLSMVQEKFSLIALPEICITVKIVDADIMPMDVDTSLPAIIARIGVSLSKNLLLGCPRHDSFRLDQESVKKFLLSRGSTVPLTESLSPAKARHQKHRKHRDVARVKSSVLLPRQDVSTYSVNSQRSASRR